MNRSLKYASETLKSSSHSAFSLRFRATPGFLAHLNYHNSHMIYFKYMHILLHLVNDSDIRSQNHL